MLAYLIGLAELLNNCHSLGAFGPPRPSIEQQIDESLQDQHLPEGEIREIRLHAKRFANEVKMRRWSQEQVKSSKSRLRWSVVESTIPATLDTKLFTPSGLTAVEQRDARRAIRQYCRALVTRKLDEQLAAGIDAMVCDPETHLLRDDLSDGQLREIVAALHRAAEEASIPANVPIVDASVSFGAEVDRLLEADENKSQ